MGRGLAGKTDLRTVTGTAGPSAPVGLWDNRFKIVFHTFVKPDSFRSVKKSSDIGCAIDSIGRFNDSHVSLAGDEEKRCIGVGNIFLFLAVVVHQ